jgi:hypothetical protein
MIAVSGYSTRSDIELAQTALVTAGIPSEIEADDAGGAYLFDLTGGARLLVDAADAAEASALPNDRTPTNGKHACSRDREDVPACAAATRHCGGRERDR